MEAVNVVGKNGYLILDIIAYKREIPPIDLEIINGLSVVLLKKKLSLKIILLIIKDARVTGKVKWFNVKIKYGFIHW